MAVMLRDLTLFQHAGASLIPVLRTRFETPTVSSLSLTALLARHFGAILSHEDLEDVLGISLYKLWEARARYDPSRPLFPWFYLIARNVAIDSLREKKWRQPEEIHLSHEGEQRVKQSLSRGVAGL